MKTRRNRLWISLALAAGSITFPYASLLWGHDLPSRLTNDGGSQSAWNYLLDDCVDIGDYSGESSASWDCAQHYSSGSPDAGLPASTGCRYDIEGDAARNGLSSFSQELTCWMDQWSRLSDQAGAAGRENLACSAGLAGLTAAYPEEGCPPTPGMRPEDTCGFQREYLSVQAAADILQAEVERATAQAFESSNVAIAETEAQVAQAAEAAASAFDIPQQYARGIDDEYLAYDLPTGDAHWIGGLNKSWKLRAALQQSVSDSVDTAPTVSIAETTTSEATQPANSQSFAQAFDWMHDAECFAASMAFDLWPMLGAGHTLGEWISSSIHFSSQHILAFGHYLHQPSPLAASQPELIIVYTDAAGDSLAVPQAFAQAWNNAESEQPVSEVAEAASAPSPIEAPSASDKAAQPESTIIAADRTAHMFDPASWRQWLLSKAASQLDSVGAFCLQTARQLSNLAQPQLATRGSADVR